MEKMHMFLIAPMYSKYFQMWGRLNVNSVPQP